VNDVDPATRVFGPDPDLDRPTLKRWWASWPRIPLTREERDDLTDTLGLLGENDGDDAA
jgi:hypothetical protein